MLYSYQYDVAAIIVTTALLLTFFIRQKYLIRSSYFFFGLVLANLLASIADLISCFTISYPGNYSLFFNQLINETYLISYNLEAPIFFLFVNEMASDDKLKKKLEKLSLVVIIVELLLIITSPFTKLIFYFDSDMTYLHGSMMFILYVFAVLFMYGSVFLMIRFNKVFNLYQTISLSAFLGSMVFCVVFQMINPRYVIGSLVAGTVLFFIFIVFENPGYYTHGRTLCYNRRAFMETVKRMHRKGLDSNMVIFSLEDYSYALQSLSRSALDKNTEIVAEKLQLVFRSRAYLLNEYEFAVMCKDPAPVKAKIDKIIGKDNNIFMSELRFSDVSDPERNITNVITQLLRNHVDNADKEYIDNNIIKISNRTNFVKHILQQAFDEDLFEVYFQPILDTKTNSFTCAEALVRIKDKGFGFVSPEEFIPIAESDGTIYELNNRVLKKLCAFIKDCDFEAMGLHYIEANISGVQCASERMADQIFDTVNSYGVDFSKINFEITETARIENQGFIKDNMNRIINEGGSFSIDDYGSGFASANYLLQYPFDIVKIDKLILWEAMKDKQAMIVLKSTIDMLKSLNKKIVVEGVETEQMRDILIENGVDYLQGYLYAKALTQDEFVDFIKKNNR